MSKKRGRRPNGARRRLNREAESPAAAPAPCPCPTPLEDLAVKRGQAPIETIEVPEKPECQK